MGCDIAPLPHQMREPRGEVHCMLSGAAADFEDMRAAREDFTQHRQDRLLVALAGVREGLHRVTPHPGPLPEGEREGGMKRAFYAAWPCHRPPPALLYSARSNLASPFPLNF